MQRAPHAVIAVLSTVDSSQLTSSSHWGRTGMYYTQRGPFNWKETAFVRLSFTWLSRNLGTNTEVATIVERTITVRKPRRLKISLLIVRSPQVLQPPVIKNTLCLFSFLSLLCSLTLISWRRQVKSGIRLRLLLTCLMAVKKICSSNATQSPCFCW
jgi:hypothetical protein